jgi:hypothetical protein
MVAFLRTGFWALSRAVHMCRRERLMSRPVFETPEQPDWTRRRLDVTRVSSTDRWAPACQSRR